MDAVVLLKQRSRPLKFLSAFMKKVMHKGLMRGPMRSCPGNASATAWTPNALEAVLLSLTTEKESLFVCVAQNGRHDSEEPVAVLMIGNGLPHDGHF